MSGTTIRALGIAGWSGSGKTTLITALIPIFRRRGLAVSTIKHAHHDLVLDRPGKDSFRHAQAGAEDVILAAGGRFALFGNAGSGLPDLLRRLTPVDLVLVEGFKNSDLPKLEVYRAALGKPPLWHEVEIRAVAADVDVPSCPAPVLNLAAPESIADFIMAMFGLNTAQRAEE